MLRSILSPRLLSSSPVLDDNAEGDMAGAGEAGVPSILVREHREGVERYCEHLTGIAAILDGWI